MRAALLHACGAPPVVGDRAVPVPAADEILVRVTAASITPLDLLCATGTSYFGVPATPYVPGVQGVGLRDDGTAVWFPTSAGMRPGDGSLAEYATVRAADTVELPDDVDHRLIAALGLSAVAAQLALTWRGELQPGEHVLVLGAGGVVGQAGVQLARLAGAGRVTAAARSQAARQRAALAGAAEVVPLKDGDDVARLAARLKAATDGPVDLVLDPLFGVPAAAALRTLRPGGRLVNLGSAAGETAPLDSATLRAGSLRILGYTNNELTAAQRSAALTLLAAHAAAGRLTVDHETVRLSDVTTAWHRTDRRMVVIP
ncbi:zinc-binding dehydrogenase [Actinoplanes auranticolor]|uniref:NADPH:quinone reductase n=1 Tax=Actinoplanes auranticolor TaxID=47988 RepID=A0A919VJ75_9ACTN|nr:zinc-binding dehydrogenase [Actinoplanes auranticolor]GIM64920.1 NADPH:quinone reductase [Actinoplanes auranticolor]